MFLKQLVNFVMLKQDDGHEIIIKYMLTHREPNIYGVLAEKHLVTGGEMRFLEECETRGGYTLQDALMIAEIFTNGKVLPTTYLEMEEELCRNKALSTI